MVGALERGVEVLYMSFFGREGDGGGGYFGGDAFVEDEERVGRIAHFY